MVRPADRRIPAMGTDGLAILAGDELKTWKHGDLVVYAPGYASTIQEFGPIEGLRKVDIVLKRGKKIHLRVRDAAGKPIPPDIIPLPQVYLPKHRRDAWFTFANKDIENRSRTIAATNFLNVRREPDGDFSFHVRTGEPTLLYFGFSHPDFLRFYELGPVSLSELPGDVWKIDLPRPATVALELKPPQGSDGKVAFEVGYYSLTPVFSDKAESVPVLDSGELRGPQWRATLKNLVPRAYNLHVNTVPGSGRPARPVSSHPGVSPSRRVKST